MLKNGQSPQLLSLCYYRFMFFDNPSRTTDTQKIFVKLWKCHECTHCPGFIAVWPWYTGQGRGVHSLTGPVVFLSADRRPWRRRDNWFHSPTGLHLFLFTFFLAKHQTTGMLSIPLITSLRTSKGPWLNVRTKTCKVCNYTTLMICFFFSETAVIDVYSEM